MIITRDFYQQATLCVARSLLGKKLIRQHGRKQLAGLIVETEAYIGENDSACHASKGKTERTAIMFGRAGHAYVYLVYGMHYMFNIVTEAEGHPSAILIRAIQPLNHIDILQKHRNIDNERLLTNGPAKLCQAYNIDKRLNNLDLCQGKKLWIEEHELTEKCQIISSPRIGIDYAEEKDRNAHWRFTIENNPFLSRK